MSRRHRGGRVGFALFSIVLGGAIAIWSTACGSQNDYAGDGLLNAAPTGGAGCATPNDGCPCDAPGVVIDCGQVEHRSGNVVSCSAGKRTCEGGAWGACEGDHFVTSTALVGPQLGGSLQPAALGMSATCTTDPCDPYCNNFIDTPGGGVTLPAGGGPPTCKAPVDWTAFYAKYAGTTLPNGALPTTCTAAPDNCSNDNVCTAGVCVPRAASASGSCVGVDFTLSTPCYDGANFTFEVCNRGTVTADTGTLPIAHDTGAPSVAASSGTRAVNGAAGQCNLNLALTPLAPGQCRQITPATDCGIDTSAGTHVFYVNYANTPAVSATASLAECNTKNNYTATVNTAVGLAGAACAPASCGASAPSGGQFAPNFSSPDGLNTGCAGAFDDVVPGSCSAAPGGVANCGQDFHCDSGSDRCKWNVTGDWVDT
ncbi:MAG: hypothetical protein M3Y06_07980, partial [Actinomycetota bacterium]|nr:hypothetical protein [Actinomycetota bacterium]